MAINWNNVSLSATIGSIHQMPKDLLPQIAFSGRSNVGKSSLLNTLIGRKNFARVSSQPGKTITINFYNVDGQFYLVDLPGYGYARRSPEEQRRWSELVEAYLHNNSRLHLIVQLIDMKVGPTADDDMMLRWLYETGTPYFVAATKADKLNKTDFNANYANLRDYDMVVEGTPVIPFSSLKQFGKEEICREILKSV